MRSPATAGAPGTPPQGGKKDVSDLTRPGAAPTSSTAATLVRVLTSVVDLVVTDHEPVAHEWAVQEAVRAAAEALAGLADDEPERTAEALDMLVAVVDALPGTDPTLFDRWQQQVRSLTPALATVRLVVSRLEAMVAEFTTVVRPPGAPVPLASAEPGLQPEPAGPDGPGGPLAPGATGPARLRATGPRDRPRPS
jgi:hypothetical protein